jgi:hypothetical protein
MGLFPPVPICQEPGIDSSVGLSDGTLFFKPVNITAISSSSFLKMGAKHFSEMSLYTYKTTRLHKPTDHKLKNYLVGQISFYILCSACPAVHTFQQGALPMRTCWV